MADVREQILVRLLAIADALVPTKATRNNGDLSASKQEQITLLDGDESLSDQVLLSRSSRGNPQVLKDLMVMTPSFVLVLGAPTEDIGSSLNDLRRRVIPTIVNDDTLISLVGPNGEIRYTGLGMETNAGDQREGRMSLDFRIAYVLSVNEL